MQIRQNFDIQWGCSPESHRSFPVRYSVAESAAGVTPRMRSHSLDETCWTHYCTHVCVGKKSIGSSAVVLAVGRASCLPPSSVQSVQHMATLFCSWLRGPAWFCEDDLSIKVSSCSTALQFFLRRKALCVSRPKLLTPTPYPKVSYI